MILDLDVYLIIRQPFKPQSVRMRYYLITMIPFILFVQVTASLSDNIRGKNYIEKTGPLILYLLVSIASLFMVIKFLLKKGTNKNLRYQILLRYGLLFLFVVPDHLVNIYYSIVYTDDHVLLSPEV